MFSQFLPGSISGCDLIRADSFRNAMIEPVNVDRADEHADEHLGVVDAVGAQHLEAERLERRRACARR